MLPIIRITINLLFIAVVLSDKLTTSGFRCRYGKEKIEAKLPVPFGHQLPGEAHGIHGDLLCRWRLAAQRATADLFTGYGFRA